MAHLCKCVYCGQQFDRDKVPFVQVRSRRYAHESCAKGEDPPPIVQNGEVIQQKQDPVLIEKENLNAYLYKVFKGDYDYMKTQKLINLYIEQGMTYSGIRKALVYYFEILGNSVDRGDPASRSIGIIPYIYEEAKNYYYGVWSVNERNKKKNIQDYIPKDIQVTISNPQRKIRKKKKFSFLDEETVSNV